MGWSSLTWICLVLAAYLIGSIPFAYVVTRLVKGQDIRRLGDGNAGAANVFRAVGSGAGLLVGIIDISKGAAAIFLARGILHSTTAEMIAGVAVIVGHNWPVHLRWRGGRGAAPATGVFLAVLPVLAVPLSLMALLLLYWSKSTIKALCLFLIPLPILAWVIGYHYSLVVYAAGIPILVGLSHYLSVRREPALVADNGAEVLPNSAIPPLAKGG